jgi:integrase
VPPRANSLEFLQAIYRSPDQPMARPRFVDHVVWAEAACRTWGFSPGAFSEAYRKNQGCERDRILSDDELRLVWAACSGVYGAFLRFLLLTAVRRSEAAGLQWSELSGSLWTIPASRMKGKAEHVVPLSGAALAILDERRSSAVPFGPIASSRRKAEFDAIVSIPHWTLPSLSATRTSSGPTLRRCSVRSGAAAASLFGS